jgi:hypothetical protein
MGERFVPGRSLLQPFAAVIAFAAMPRPDEVRGIATESSGYQVARAMFQSSRRTSRCKSV